MKARRQSIALRVPTESSSSEHRGYNHARWMDELRVTNSSFFFFRLLNEERTLDEAVDDLLGALLLLAAAVVLHLLLRLAERLAHLARDERREIGTLPDLAHGGLDELARLTQLLEGVVAQLRQREVPMFWIFLV